MAEEQALDALDLAVLTALHDHPRAGAMELSRVTRVARATLQSRLRRLEQRGVVTGYGPDVDLTAAGFPVQAFVTLEIAQGALDQVAGDLEAVAGVVAAWATTGSGDVLCHIAATSHQDLQATLLELSRSPAVVRSTSVVALSVVVPPRVLSLLASTPREGASRAPAHRAQARRAVVPARDRP